MTCSITTDLVVYSLMIPLLWSTQMPQIEGVVLMKVASSGEQSNNVSFNLLTLKISKVIITTDCHKLYLVTVMRILYIQSNSFT